MKKIKLLLIIICCHLSHIGISQNNIREITCVGLITKDVATGMVKNNSRDDAMILTINEGKKEITVKTITRFNGNFIDEYYYKDFIQSPYAKIYTCFKKNQSTDKKFFISILENKVSVMFDKLIFESNIKNDITYSSANSRDKIYENSDKKIGRINGTDVILRENHSTKSKILGSFKNSGEKVDILGTYIDEKAQALIAEDITFSINETDFELKKGKAVSLIDEKNGYYTISFKDKNLQERNVKLKTDYVTVTDFSKWYYVKRANGQKGWVFGKFITE